MVDFFSIFLPRSLTRVADGSYKVLNGLGAAIDPSGPGTGNPASVNSTVLIGPVLDQLAVAGSAPDTVWLYEGDAPLPGSPEWDRYAEKLQALLGCEVLDARENSRYVNVPGYGRFLARK